MSIRVHIVWFRVQKTAAGSKGLASHSDRMPEERKTKHGMEKEGLHEGESGAEEKGGKDHIKSYHGMRVWEGKRKTREVFPPTYALNRRGAEEGREKGKSRRRKNEESPWRT